MNRNFEKILLIVLVMGLIGISVYLWLVIATWALSFVMTLLTIGIIIYAIARFRSWISKGKSSSLEKRNDDFR